MRYLKIEGADAFGKTERIVAEILLTVGQRKRITLQQAKAQWGSIGMRAVRALVGHVEDDFLTTEEPSTRVACLIREDEGLILTKFGRKAVDSLESISDIAWIVAQDGKR